MSQRTSVCPVCNGQISIALDAVATEILTCAECSNRIVIESITPTEINLTEAPAIEEDWGE